MGARYGYYFIYLLQESMIQRVVEPKVSQIYTSEITVCQIVGQQECIGCRRAYRYELQLSLILTILSTITNVFKN